MREGRVTQEASTNDDAPQKAHRSFVAFFGRREGRGSGALEKYNLRAEFVSILVMLLFGLLIVTVAYCGYRGRL